MTMEVNPQGWKKRRERARKRRIRNQERTERAAQATQAPQEPQQAVQAVQEPVRPVTPQQPSQPVPAAVASPVEAVPPVTAMGWDELAAEMRAAGKFVPPKIKLEKLRNKVRELRRGKEETAAAPPAP